MTTRCRDHADCGSAPPAAGGGARGLDPPCEVTAQSSSQLRVPLRLAQLPAPPNDGRQGQRHRTPPANAARSQFPRPRSSIPRKNGRRHRVRNRKRKKLYIYKYPHQPPARRDRTRRGAISRRVESRRGYRAAGIGAARRGASLPASLRVALRAAFRGARIGADHTKKRNNPDLAIYCPLIIANVIMSWFLP